MTEFIDGPDIRRSDLVRLAEQSSDVLWLFSPGFDELLFVNAAYEAVWGRPTADLRADPTALLDGVHPDDRGAVRDAIERVSAGESVDLDCRVDPTEDYERWVSLSADPVAPDDGSVARIVASARDVTETRRHRTDRDRYRTILRNVPDGVYLFDTDEVLVFVNRAAVEASSATREEMLGTSVAELIESGLTGETPVEEVLAAHDRLQTGEREEIRQTLWFDTADGPRPFAVRSSRGESEDGETIGVVSVLRDISERIEAEERLRRKNERLEEFASIVSHDLRNPLNVAAGQAELARAEHDSEHLREVVDAHDRMETLIQDLLTLARQGSTVDDPEPVDLGDLAENCWHTVDTAGATLEILTTRSVQADRNRLRQLFENLVRNAVEHGSTSPDSAARRDAVEHGSTSPRSQGREDAVEHGGGDLTITVGDLDDGFYVADDGVGIPERIRERVFESGFSTHDDGTGFGLTIVEEIASAHGWSVAVTESEDGGTRFEITGVGLVD